MRLLEPFLGLLVRTTNTPHFDRVADAILNRLFHQAVRPLLKEGEDEAVPIGVSRESMRSIASAALR